MTNADVYKQISISKHSNWFASLQNSSEILSTDNIVSTERSKQKSICVTRPETFVETQYDKIKELSRRTDRPS